MNRQTAFDPDKVAHFEAAGWRAYYDRQWLPLLRLTIQLCQEQFRIPFPTSLRAAYYVTRGALAWVPIDHDRQKIERYYLKFYRLAGRYSGLRFDPVRVARLEIQYWDEHRRLVGQENKSTLLQTLIELHSATFGITAEQARLSAESRLLAANLVDGITGRTSTDPEADWAKLEEHLRDCYRSILREMTIRPDTLPPLTAA